MANAPARKPNRNAPPKRKTSPTPVKKTKCNDCGMAGGKHKSLCPRFECTTCHLIGGKHAIKCAQHPDNQPIVPAAPKNDAARSEAAKRGSQAPAGLYFPVDIIEGALEAFQKSINDGDFSGDIQKMTVCEYEEPGAEGGVVKCTNFAMIKKRVKRECPTCERSQKKTLNDLCVGHAINVHGGGHPHHLQTSMDLSK